MNFIATLQEVDKIHEFIKTNGSADTSQLFQPIIMLYINKADWGTLIDYIKQMLALSFCFILFDFE